MDVIPRTLPLNGAVSHRNLNKEVVIMLKVKQSILAENQNFEFNL